MTAGPEQRTNARLLLGELWRGLCQRTNLGRRDIEAALGCSVSKAARILDGEVGVKASDLAKLLDLFDATEEERGRAEQLARETWRRQPKEPGGSVVPEKWQRLYKLEPSASEIRIHSTTLVHGLLQTAGYARELFARPHRDESRVERLVAQRVARRERVLAEGGPKLSVILDESVLRWLVGGPEVMASQLGYLLELSKMDRVDIRVVPFASGVHPAMGSTFSILLHPSGLKDRAFVHHENVADSMLHDDLTRVAPYLAAFDALAERALPPSKSADLIATVVAGLRQQQSEGGRDDTHLQ